MAKKVLVLFEDLNNNRTEELQKLKELEEKLKEYSIPLVRDRNKEKEKDNEEGEEERKPVIDDDGFMLVTKKWLDYWFTLWMVVLCIDTGLLIYFNEEYFGIRINLELLFKPERY